MLRGEAGNRIGRGQHAERVGEDALRKAWLESQDFRVLRFWNDAVLQRMDDVLEEIIRNYPSPQPLSHKVRGAQKKPA
ncbi:MAG: DUF559 domain-containing protein [Rhodanobacteraceae bacterium]